MWYAAVRHVQNDSDGPLITVSAVADAIAGSYSKPAIYTVSVLVVRYGLKRLCEDGNE